MHTTWPVQQLKCLTRGTWFHQVITHEEAEHLQKHGDFLIMEEVRGHIYGVTKAAVQAVQYQNKVTLVPCSLGDKF